MDLLPSVLFSSPHGRQRRDERHIAKATLVLARRYGMKETDVLTGRIRYTYAGVTFIYDPFRHTEITSYASADYASPLAGTRRGTIPIFPRRKYSEMAGGNAEDRVRVLQHAQLRTRLFHDRAQWTSHSVIIVDMSGSMRIDDVDGARCRSDAVWLSLAKDHVERALQSKQAVETDVMSVISMMGDAATASIVLRCEPTDYVLFNTLLHFREWDTIRPEGPGHYRPALTAATNLLRQYDTRQQALSLTFVSDGAPSDEKEVVDDLAGEMGRIAQEFGRRLSITCIGIGNDDDHNDGFRVLQDMVGEAQAYHSNASFYRAAGLYSSSALSDIFTCLSSFTAMSKVEMTRCGVATGSDDDDDRPLLLTVRNDVVREKYDTLNDNDLSVDDGQWTVYNSRHRRGGDSSSSVPGNEEKKNQNDHDHDHDDHGLVIRVWAWDRVKDDFVCLLDPRCLVCCDLVGECCTSPSKTKTKTTTTTTTMAAAAAVATDKGELCAKCQACFVCHECRKSPEFWIRHSPVQCQRWLKQRRVGAIVMNRPLPSFSIAIKKAFFSEGVERMVAKTRFIDETTHSFIGPKMVAKQSRFVEEDSSYEARMDYHRQFMRTQAIASALATKFNAAVVAQLALTATTSTTTTTRRRRIPTIRFLDPLVFELTDARNQQEVNQLVEEMLVGPYVKFNNNTGFVRHDADHGVICCAETGDLFPIHLTTTTTTESNNDNKYQHASLSARVQNLFQKGPRPPVGSLAAVPEDNGSNGEGPTTATMTTSSSSSSVTSDNNNDNDNVDPYEMMQAFSHFTYECSKNNLIVIDLQGILALDHDPPEVVLTDPAIHTRCRTKTTNRIGQLNLGRTDRGDKGIASFFQTHECGPTCQRLGLSRRSCDLT
jgi:Alpha-kinase family